MGVDQVKGTGLADDLTDGTRRQLLKAAAGLTIGGVGTAALAGTSSLTTTTQLPATGRDSSTASAAIAGRPWPDASAAGGKVSAPEDPLSLWYPRPASQWVEALPLGNGRLGAMVFGGISHERLQINEDTVYAGGPYSPANPDAKAALGPVRRLIQEGRFVEAETLVNSTMMGKPLRQMPFQPLADLVMDFRGLNEIRDYRRDLSLDGALATTGFVAGNVAHIREIFISPVDQCIAIRLRTVDKPGRLNVRIWFDDEHGMQSEAKGASLLLTGQNAAHEGVDGRLKLAAHLQAHVVGKGTVTTDGRSLSVHGAQEVVLLITAATSYRRYDDVSADPVAITSEQMAAAASRSWANLLDRHQQDHRRLFRRVQIDLGRSDAQSLPTDERVKRFGDGNDPALAALYHQFGRYLLICCSRPGSQPANLQGVWNDLMSPPWDSKYTININTQMNYWPAHSGNLAECTEPLHRMIEDLARSGVTTAATMYGARGWVTHHNTDLWRASAPIDGARTGMWPCGGAWLSLHLWEHWDYTRDRRFLEQAYPVLKGAAQFFADTLWLDPATGERVTSPSMSPENEHPFGTTLCAGPAMDSQILRDLFEACAQAADVLGRDAGFARELRALRATLAADRIGAAGQLQEWREDWDMQAPDRHHRHVSHLYALYPSDQINLRDSPALAAAAKLTLDIRGDDATGWGLGWRLNLWARLAEPTRAHRILALLLSPDRTYPNLFDAHPPFQIDGNFGGTAGITEMLVQSWGDSIFLLPALPTQWPTGSIMGVRVRGAATVSLQWKEGVPTDIRIESEHGGLYRVAWQGQTLDVNLRRGQSRRLTSASGRLQMLA